MACNKVFVVSEMQLIVHCAALPYRNIAEEPDVQANCVGQCCILPAEFGQPIAAE